MAKTKQLLRPATSVVPVLVRGEPPAQTGPDLAQQVVKPAAHQVVPPVTLNRQPFGVIVTVLPAPTLNAAVDSLHHAIA